MSQTKHLLPQVEKYFRTNLHTHTNLTDGVPFPEEMKKIYKDKDFVLENYPTDIPYADMTNNTPERKAELLEKWTH